MDFLSRDISTRWPWSWCRLVCVKKQQQCNDVLQSPGQRPLHHAHDLTSLQDGHRVVVSESNKCKCGL